MVLRLRHDPLYATFLLQGIIAMFKAYSTLSDPGLFLSMFSIFPEIYPRQYLSFTLYLRDISWTLSRSQDAYRDNITSPTCIIASSSFPSFMARRRHGKCQFLLCVNPGFWIGQRIRCGGRYLGRIEDCVRRAQRRVGDSPDMRFGLVWSIQREFEY